MRIPRIYTPAPLTSGQALTLDDNAANHVGRVLRMKPEQAVTLFNGDGMEYHAVLESVDKRQVTAHIQSAEPNQAESPLSITLGQVISRGDRMDFAVQKSVEMGVTRIVPLVSERCEVRLKPDREAKRIRHWRQVAISAAEQCGRSRVPQIDEVCALDDWFDTAADHDLKLVLHHRSEHSLDHWQQPASVALMIGPEGGLSPGEIETALKRGFHPATLGPRVMRTETAPVAAMALLQWLWGDWQPRR
ncbi:16S rRNA (uracil(1498)-N(3))-methyltransferase [Marinobacteraceae bacterium S3BR75-40.1]